MTQPPTSTKPLAGVTPKLLIPAKSPTSAPKKGKVRVSKPEPVMSKGALRRGIREQDKATWKHLLGVVRRAQGNLMEVARRTGLSRETLRRWEQRYEVLRKAIVRAAKGNAMLWQQKRRWSPERRKQVAERERKHQQEQWGSGKFHWESRADIPLPEGVQTGKRAVWVMRPRNPWGHVLWGAVLVLRTTKKSVFVHANLKDVWKTRKIKPGSLMAWSHRADEYFPKEVRKTLAELERNYQKIFCE